MRIVRPPESTVLLSSIDDNSPTLTVWIYLAAPCTLFAMRHNLSIAVHSEKGCQLLVATMQTAFALFLLVLPALGSVESPIRPARCREHKDSFKIAKYRPPLIRQSLLRQSFALCDFRVCTPQTNFTCKNTNDCGFGWGCRAGKCALGSLGATCRAVLTCSASTVYVCHARLDFPAKTIRTFEWPA